MFPLKVRAKCLSMTTATNWLFNWAIAYATPYMVNEEYANLQSKVFFLWGSFCFVCIAFVWFMIYETKGLSLEEVDELFGVCSKAWESKKFRPQVSFRNVKDVTEGDGGRGMSFGEAAEAVQRKKSVTHVEDEPNKLE